MRGDRARRGATAAWSALATALLGLLSLVPPATAAQPTDSAAEVVVSSMTPAVPTTGQILSLSGTVTNPGAMPYNDVQVQLRLSSRLTGRSEITAVVAGEEIEKSSSVVPASVTDLAPQIAPGAQVPWTIAVDVDALGLRTAGVHVLTVEVLGRADGFRRAQLIAQTELFLPWQGPGSAPSVADATLQVAWLLPLVDIPRRDPEGVFVDDGLAADLAPTGRLGGLLAAGADQEVTWVVDPDLLETVADMADGYQVRNPADPARTVPGTGAEMAVSWLAQARTILTAGPATSVLTTPYADPDVVALRRAERTEDLTYATTLAPEIARAVLGRDVTADLVWPPDGMADDDTLTALRAAGARGAIVSDRLVPPAESVTFTPTGRTSLATAAGPLDGLVVDAATSNALDPTGSRSLVAARQELLAQTLMTARERPTVARTVLLAPPRRWTASHEWAATLLTADTQAPWTTRVPLATLRAEAVPDVQRQPVTYPAAAQEAELSPRYLAGVATVQEELRTVGSLLTDPSVAAQFDEGILRAESSAWRGRVEGGTGLLASSATALSEVEHGVRLVAGQDVILGGHEGTFGVSIANDLANAVTVALRVRPRNSAALRVEQPDPVTIQPGRTTQVTVTAEASANGSVDVDLQLATPSGQSFGDPVPIQVRATEYGTLAAFITGAAMAVLFLASAVRLTRRAVRRRARTRTARRAVVPAPAAPADAAERVEERIEETTP